MLLESTGILGILLPDLTNARALQASEALRPPVSVNGPPET